VVKKLLEETIEIADMIAAGVIKMSYKRRNSKFKS
jgi:hypothetical protein